MAGADFPAIARVMRVDAFDFDLPEELIALRPARPRDSARLLVVRGPDGVLEDRHVRDLPELLSPGDFLVMNDTRVIHAALVGTRAGRLGGDDITVEVNLNRRLDASTWSAFAKPAKRLREGDEVTFKGLVATVLMREGADVRLRFGLAGAELDAAIERVGAMPLPPYIAGRRAPDEADDADYQTTFAREAGSVAAPTAGLHFTPELMQRLSARGVDADWVTLHVNAGTFLPMKVDDTDDHKMHPERAELTQSAAARIRNRKGRCIPVGTTALRTLESAAASGELLPYSGDTSIFITPGYKFRAAEGLITNFHLPRSTLFMLVSAMMGLDVMQRAYQHAIRERYRFYSYGDACLLLPGTSQNG